MLLSKASIFGFQFVHNIYANDINLLHEKVHFFKILVPKLVRWKIQRNHKISKFSKTQREPKLVEIAKLSEFNLVKIYELSYSSRKLKFRKSVLFFYFPNVSSFSSIKKCLVFDTLVQKPNVELWRISLNTSDVSSSTGLA